MKPLRALLPAAVLAAALLSGCGAVRALVTPEGQADWSTNTVGRTGE